MIAFLDLRVRGDDGFWLSRSIVIRNTLIDNLIVGRVCNHRAPATFSVDGADTEYSHQRRVTFPLERGRRSK